MHRLVSLTGVLIAAASLSACGGDREHYHADGSHHGRLTLSATGEERAAPDMAVVTAGVTAQADTAAAAMADQRENMSTVMAALATAGVAPGDIQTSGLDLSPVYAPYDRDNQDRPVVGYRVSNRVTVTVRDIPALGAMLDAVVASGANTIDGVRFDIDDASTLVDTARREAVETLMARAQLYADAGGFRLGRILEMNEGGQNQPYQPAYTRTAAAEMSADTPVSGGQLNLSVTVTATFEIERRR